MRFREQQWAVVRICVLMLAAMGCNQVFGLDETVAIADQGMVNGVYMVRWVENQSDGTPIAKTAPYSLDQIEADVELDDGTKRDVALAADGTFSFTTALVGQRYSLTFRSPNSSRTYQHDSTNLVLVDRVAGRPDRQLVPANTVLALVTNRPPATSTAREEVMSTGIWARKDLTGAPDLRFDWSSAAPMSAPLGLLDAARNDTAYYVHYDQTPTYYRPTVAARAPVTLRAGDITTVTATAQTVTATECTHLQWDARSEVDRINSSIDDEVGALAVWTIVAVATHEFGPIAKLPLAYPLASVATVTVDETASYGNPFLGGTRNAELAVIVYRTQTAWITVEATTPAAADCPTPTILPVGTIQYPLAVRLAGTELVSDDQIVAIDRSAGVPVTWQASPTGTADDAQVLLIEIVGSPPNQVSTVKAIVYTTANEATLDSALLEPGHTYLLEVKLRGGVPDAASGDYDRIETTHLAGGLQTRSFRVQ